MKAQEERAIWIVDDDLEDHELIKDIFKELESQYPLELFETAEQLLGRLDEVKSAPFIIISAVNLPKMGGFELREQLLKHQTTNSIRCLSYSGLRKPQKHKCGRHMI